ncbi:hypothetical protein BDZ94DRAFT_1260194 [Collybia nuda]|uniref:Uncharacterized protein n=1 Tax=Collybia nuda TaxID=64659 RepID=A0A9P5Y610_9AGAR|nr:hypothetical protein BDZ94DRAFT_1260194 [Collybia nuda]
MDDPWANAWGEPSKHNINSPSTWVPSTTNDVQDSETDLAMPSWATGAEVEWAEPSDAQGALWGANLPSKEWTTSPYDSIYLGKSSVEELPQPSEFLPPEPTRLSSPAPSSHLIETRPLENNAVTSQPSSTAASSFKSISPPDSPDAFGTFETGLNSSEPDTDSWPPSGAVSDPTSLEADAWGDSGWGVTSSVSDVPRDKKPIDEWENAKQQKERQDRHVPPEVLASILHQFEEFSLELWPKATDASDRGVDNKYSSRQGEIEKTNDLTNAVNKLIPQNLTLPPYIHFSKTFTSKYLGESLRFTRHAATTRSSPMAIYFASKGSTAWETSIKSRPENLKDDLLPPGWRVIEKEKDSTFLVLDPKKKASGGLLSFFGRRGGPTPPSAVSVSRPASPVRPPSSASVATPSLSISVRSSDISVDSSSSPQVRSSTPVTSFSPVGLSRTSLESDPVVPSPSSTPTILSPSQQNPPETTPPSSAVSRFLTRFSRSKTTGSNPRNSLALSTDDLEFLSDIVPSAHDEVDEASQLRELSSMIGSSPLPTKLPAPLPPPPRLLPLARASPNNSTLNIPNGMQPSGINDDLLSMFNSPVTNPPISSADPEPQTSSTKFTTNPPVAKPLSPSDSIIGGTLISTTNKVSSPFDFPPAPNSASRSRIPPLQKRTPIAIMSTNAVSLPPHSTSFAALPPPPSSRIPPPIPLLHNTEVTTARTSTQAPISSQKFQQLPLKEPSTFGIADDDDFNDFHSTPVVATTSFDSSVSSVFSDKSLISSSSASTSGSKDLIDDFDDFVSSPLRTPSPPRLPEKHALFGHKPSRQSLPPRNTSPTGQQPRPLRRVSRAADHQRTMSLLDIAATRQGKWPAPASPLPHALPPPPVNLTLSGFNTLSEDSTIAPSISSPANFKDSDMTPRLLNSLPSTGITTFPLPQLRAISPPTTIQQSADTKSSLLNVLPTSPAVASSGGLSAQDLSFFEGI